ncbi:MAG: hypothetical protein ACREXT_10810, partial [Gammaproteobacteria bacterium]
VPNFPQRCRDCLISASSSPRFFWRAEIPAMLQRAHSGYPHINDEVGSLSVWNHTDTVAN